jgi:hypothetical protein
VQGARGFPMLQVNCYQPRVYTYCSAKPKASVVLSARVHPGETVGSWMMKGTLDFLTGPSILADMLRSTFCFIILPMLTPDGVVQGNYRTSLAGCDLNRKYENPLKVFLSISIYIPPYITTKNYARSSLLSSRSHS